MFDFLTSDSDAIAILKKDHDTVKELFDQFKKAESLQEKKPIVGKAIMELKIHAAIEEEIFYPALRSNKVDKDMLNEADEEHHVAKLLIAELEQMNGKEEHYDAKFTVLSENIRHHIREEEGDLFPKARATGLDFLAIGKKLLARKAQLKKSGVDTFAEEKLIFASKKGSGDSPAQAARKKPAIKLVKASSQAKAKPKAKKPVAKAKRSAAKPKRRAGKR